MCTSLLWSKSCTPATSSPQNLEGAGLHPAALCCRFHPVRSFRSGCPTCGEMPTQPSSPAACLSTKLTPQAASVEAFPGSHSSFIVTSACQVQPRITRSCKASCLGGAGGYTRVYHDQKSQTRPGSDLQSRSLRLCGYARCSGAVSICL